MRVPLQSATDADGTTVEWTERVMLITSNSSKGDSSNSAKPYTTTCRARQRQIRELEVLNIRRKRFSSLIELRGCYTYEHYPATKTVGERYQITAVTLNTAAIAQDKQTLAGVSMSPTHALSSYRSKMQS